jgi:hypothetical protein
MARYKPPVIATAETNINNPKISFMVYRSLF